jgi:hypothetical protein
LNSNELSLYFLIGIIFNMNAQYEPIIKSEGVLWKLTHEHWDYPVNVEINLSDTISIDSNVYTKVLFDNTVIGGVGYYNGLGGYLREDTTSGKAWFKGVADTVEHLIMDLSLQLGDSIYVHILPFSPSFAKITSIDTIQNRKVLTTDYFYGGGIIYEYLRFIEGVGPSASLLHQIEYETRNVFETDFSYKVCNMFIGATSSYEDSCPTFISVKDIIKNEDIIGLYPNPSSGDIYLENIVNPTTINIFDTHNKLVYKEVLTSNSNRINVSIPKGIYLYHLISNTEISTGKLVIIQ